LILKHNQIGIYLIFKVAAANGTISQQQAVIPDKNKMCKAMK